MTPALCAVCGATLTQQKRRGRLPYCKTRVCADGYAVILVKSRVHIEAGHMIWDGSYRHNRPYCFVEYAKDGRRMMVTVNPMEVLWRDSGGPKPTMGQKLSRSCEEPRCIGHLSVRPRREAVPVQPRLTLPRPNLPVAPLVAALAARDCTLSESDALIVRRSLDSGEISLYTADRICIDALGIHPYFVYGDLFYDAR